MKEDGGVWETNNLVKFPFNSLLLTGSSIFCYLCCRFLFAEEKCLLKFNSLESDSWIIKGKYFLITFVNVEGVKSESERVRMLNWIELPLLVNYWLEREYWIRIWHQTQHNWTDSMNLINFNPDFIKLSFAKRFLLKFVLFIYMEYFMCTKRTRHEANKRKTYRTQPCPRIEIILEHLLASNDTYP